MPLCGGPAPSGPVLSGSAANNVFLTSLSAVVFLNSTLWCRGVREPALFAALDHGALGVCRTAGTDLAPVFFPGESLWKRFFFYSAPDVWFFSLGIWLSFGPPWQKMRQRWAPTPAALCAAPQLSFAHNNLSCFPFRFAGPASPSAGPRRAA